VYERQSFVKKKHMQNVHIGREIVDGDYDFSIWIVTTSLYIFVGECSVERIHTRTLLDTKKKSSRFIDVETML